MRELDERVHGRCLELNIDSEKFELPQLLFAVAVLFTVAEGKLRLFQQSI